MANGPHVRRERTILSQRHSGLTMKEIARRHGISPNRARQILLRALARREWERANPATIASLSTRARHVLWNLGLSPDSKRGAVKPLLPDLRRGVGSGRGAIRNLGVRTLSEIERWLRGPSRAGREDSARRRVSACEATLSRRDR